MLNPLVLDLSFLFLGLRNGDIEEVGHLLLADSRLWIILPIAVDAVEVSVLVLPGEVYF